MPAADPADQEAARAMESKLREAIQRCEQPPVELAWFSTLPKRIRRSGRLLEAAQTEAKILLDHIRADWARHRQVEQEREERLNRAKALPRDLDCLRAPDPKAWNGLGRRKKRCRTFEAVGRAFNTRQRVPAPTSSPQQSPVDVHLVNQLFETPDRPPTPPGLLAALANIPGLLGSALVEHNYGINTPATPASVPTPHSPVPMPETATLPPIPAYPHSVAPGELTVFSREVDRDAAYIIARGRFAWAPVSDCPLRDVAVDIVSAEEFSPGALGLLASLLFPAGVSCYDKALDPVGLEVLVDFVRGWYEICTHGF